MKNDRIKRIKMTASGIALLAAVICYSVYGFGSAEPVLPEQNGKEKPEFVLDTGSSGESDLDVRLKEEGPDGAGSGKETTESGADAAGMQTTGRIFVHVCGEVTSPGVYELEEGSRLYQAVEKAGGFTEKAAADFLNMAQVLEDGVQIQVPDREKAEQLLKEGKTGVNGSSGNGTVSLQEPGGMSGGKAGQGTGDLGSKVNINTAPKEQLMTLTGIGEARAEAIITYRSEHGAFGRIEDIMEVSGIKEAAFQKIREDITV